MLKNHLSRYRNKQEYYNKVRELLLYMKNDILNNKDLYSDKDIIFFESVINNANYYLFKLRYFIIFKIWRFVVKHLKYIAQKNNKNIL